MERVSMDNADVQHHLEMFLQRYIPGAQLSRKFGKEISFRPPKGTESSFPDAFDALELESRSLGVGAFGIENASLEEVFLLLGENTGDAELDGNDTTAEDADLTSASAVHLLQPKRLSRFGQIGLLYWKRLVIQKRDLKGFFFSIIVPVLLVGLVLLVLTINVPLVGPTIELSPSLYRGSSTNEAVPTDVFIAGSSPPLATGAPAETLAPRYARFASFLAEKYENIETRPLENVSTSEGLSRLLLATYNEPRNSRYAAFVINDTINASSVVNWNALKDDIYAISETEALQDVDSIDFAQLLSNETSDTLRLNILLSDIAYAFYNATGLVPNTTANATNLRLVLTRGLREIFSSKSISIESNVSEWERVFRESLVEISIEGNRTASTLVSLIGTLTEGSLDVKDFFDTSVVRSETVGILESLIGVYGGDVDMEVYNGLEVIVDGVPSSLTVATIVAVDTFLNQLTQVDGTNTTISLGEVFSVLGEILGGGPTELDGTAVTLEVSRADLDLSSATIVLSDVRVLSGSAVLLDIEDGSSFNISVKDFVALLPNETADYQYQVSTEMSILHNSSSPHAVGAFNQALMEYLVRSCTGDDTLHLISVNYPLPLTTQQAVEVLTILSILASFFVLIPYCYVPGAFIVTLVKERTCKSKHLQLVSGVSMGSYWIAHYLWDLTLFLILTICVMAVLMVYSVDDSADVLVGDLESFCCTFLLTFGYGLSVLPFSYLLSRSFTNHSSAQIAVIGIVFITGFVSVNAYYIMSSIDDTQAIAEAMVPVFRSWPAFNLGEGFIRMSRAYWEKRVLFIDRSPFDWEVAGKSLTLVYMIAVPYFTLLLILEYAHDGGAGGVFGRLLRYTRGFFESCMLRIYGVRKAETGLLLDDGLNDSAAGHDDDVEEERLTISQNASEFQKSSSVLFVNLWKVYPPSVGLFGVLISTLRRAFATVFCCFCRINAVKKTEAEREEERRAYQPKRAVRGVATAVRTGEPFALLGANGAGKTSILGVLTGDIPATSGHVYVAGHDITGEELNGATEARKHIGPCPQVDPLLDLMTGRETLQMFAKLRGVPRSKIESEVERLMERLTLTSHADKVSEAYSGGNKRKLSLGIALIGEPKVLLIDESSSGLDPAAKRHMWNLISEVSRDRSVILTTHSMQEAEALCTRAGIMANGKLLCLGSVQHLKSKYLDGYTIDLFCNPHTTKSRLDAVVTEVVENALPGSRLVERHGRFLRIDIRSLSSLGLGTTFRRLEALKETPYWHVENYSIRQCSLEQVFMQLVSESTAVSQDVKETNAIEQSKH